MTNQPFSNRGGDKPLKYPEDFATGASEDNINPSVHSKVAL